MLKGFYTLASGMLSQNRNLNTISNNMANVSTPGYKRDTLVSKTFQEELLYRTGNKDKSGSKPLNTSSMIRTIDESVTNYTQGVFEETDRPLDFAIVDKGFFEIQTDEGSLYTRNGSFTLDDEGYLSLQHVGRVMGENGPILLNTDKINVDSTGTIYSEEGEELGIIKVVDFNDYNQLSKINEGMFRNNDI
ncbi:flagellar hook-basal body protein [Anaerovorax odorimutans]|uniref:flagellar hook-basal body protein n=1 Tax=Anaerovorax odorimutans TaxID=109327 RepID=UPI00042413A1|nr:flagellar hook-basal body complex protein [Anaerovorax odorimutans]